MAAPEDRITRSTVLTLVAMGLGVFILANDFSAINVALPTIERDLDTDLTAVQWVINAYGLVFGMLIVTGGGLADTLGRRRVFFAGAAIFAATSVLGGLAPSIEVLIASRALMGIGAALMWPAILGMTYAALPAAKAGLAGGLIIGASGIGQAVGPVLGGVLTEYLSWRWVYFVNVPIAAAAVVITWFTVRAPRGEGGRRIDYVGILTLSLGLVALLFGLDQGDDWGWGDPRIIASFVVAAAALGTFLLVERRARSDALVPADVMRNRDFTAACVAIALLGTIFVVSILYLPQFEQRVLEYSPVRAGLGLLPLFVPFAAVSFVAGPLYNRFGAKPTVSAGAFFLTLGAILLAFLPEDAGYTSIVPGMLAIAAGLGLFFASATNAGVAALDPDRQSLAGGLVYMFQIMGGAIGLGLATTIFTVVGGSGRAELIDGFNAVFLLLSALGVAGLLVSLFFVGGPLRPRPQSRASRVAGGTTDAPGAPARPGADAPRTRRSG